MARKRSEKSRVRKRGDGEGSIFLRADGLWVGRISLGFCERTGKRLQKTIYGKTHAEALSKLDDLRQRQKQGVKGLLAKDSVGAFLQNWLENHIALNRAGKTLQEYSGIVKLYITPYIGTTQLTKLDGEMLVHWQAKLAREGKSADIRRRTIKILRACLNFAVKLRTLQINPCNVLDKPRVHRKEVTPLEPADCHKLFAACKSHRLGDLIILAALTGLRKGELFALEWTAVNLAERVLVVRRSVQELASGLSLKEPKTQAGRRVVVLSDEAVAALKSRLKKAKAEGFEPEEVPFVFPNLDGGLLRGSNFDRRVWHPIRLAAGLPESFVFHDLRHTMASLMLAAGVDLKVIQKRLGHQDFSTTANTYSHLLQNAQNDAAEKLSGLLKMHAPKNPTDDSSATLPESGEYKR